ncbi:MAG: hypothetical protein OHK0017_09090 [Patescibacteria group bacterium]
MLLPSILEYDQVNLNRKTNFLLQNLNSAEFIKSIKILESDTRKIQSSLNLHLDFVLPQFAKDRGGILTSSGLESILNHFSKKFDQTKLNLTVHLMGELEDMRLAWDFWSKFKPNKKWKITILVPVNHYLPWKTHFKKFNIGIWIDLHDWLELPESEVLSRLPEGVKDILIMTVVAGKSGQKLETIVEHKLQGLIIELTHSLDRFVLDGGWSQTKAQNFLNNIQDRIPLKKQIDFVSYGSFWSQYNLV